MLNTVTTAASAAGTAVSTATKSAVDLDLRWTIPTLTALTALCGLFVVGTPPQMTFDHLMPAAWIPTALALSKFITLGAPILATSHSLAATYSPRAS